MKYIALSALFTSIFLAALGTTAETSRPMSEMHGACGAFETNLASELKAWDQKEINLTQGADQKIPLGEKAKIQLSSEDKVKLVAPPEKSFPVKDSRYAGLLKFSVKEDGDYRVSLGAKLWLDVIPVRTKKPLEAVSFEMQTKCDKIFKTVLFKLEKNQEYFVQLSSSKAPEVDLLISKP